MALEGREAADKKMGLAYEAIRAQLSKKELELLKASQQAWQAYRISAAWCYAYVVAQNGTMARSLKESTATDLAEMRAIELNNSRQSPKVTPDLAADLKTSDDRLNTIYQQLLSQLDDEGKKKLRESERLWLAYRDAQVSFQASVYAGSTATPEEISKAISRDLIETRIHELHAMLKQ